MRRTASNAALRCAGAGTPCAPPAAVAAFCLVSGGGPAGPIVGRFEAMAFVTALLLRHGQPRCGGPRHEVSRRVVPLRRC